jgi:tetratricopeptide (TPR) repeat protein
MNSLKELLRELHRRSVWQVIGIYLATSWGVLNAVDVLTGFAGLPDWTPTMALVLLLIGFPIVTATAVIQKGLPGGRSSVGVADRAESEVPGGRAVSEGAPSSGPANGPEPSVGIDIRTLFTWRNALLGGAAAGALLLVSGGAYVAMWALGVGPVGSLVAQGVLDSRDPVLLVDFDDRTDGGDLGAIVAEALAVDLGASPVVTLLGDDAVENALRLMDRDPSESLTSDLAREVALRTNIKAYIEGEVTRVGSRYLIVARIVSPLSGEALVSLREEAAGDDDLLPAIDRLSQGLREKLGESLRDIRLGAPLEEVTTGSFEALRKLTQAEAAEEEGDYALAERLLEEAIALDPEFAMAHRKLSVLFFNTGRPSELIDEAATLAYQYRHRLTDRERYLTEANYHANVTRDDLAALEAYDALLSLDPDDAAALNNSANILRRLTRHREAQDRLDRAVGVPRGSSSVAYFNNARTRFLLADTAGTLEAIRAYRERYPGHIYQTWADLLETMAVGETAGVEGRIRAVSESRDLGVVRRQAARWGMAAAIGRGALSRALEWIDGVSPVVWPFSYAGYLPGGTGVADVRYWILDDPEGAVEALQTLSETSFEMEAADQRPWGEMVSIYALSGRPDLARELLARWQTELAQVPYPVVAAHQATARAMIDVAEGRTSTALDEIGDAARDLGCPRCFEQQRAVILEGLGRLDEAITIWRTVRDYPALGESSGFERAVARKRLGPLLEAAGDTAGAIAAYQEFADAWADADPELQPQVTHARGRIAALGGSPSP